MQHIHAARSATAASPLSRFPSRIRTLAVCLSAALATPLVALQAAASPGTAQVASSRGAAIPKTPTHALGQSWTVKNCDDSGTDSLRGIIENPMTLSGDTVDLTELPVRCGMTDSVITLASEIAVAQDDLTLLGPTEGTATISAAGISRVFHHTGTGTLSLNGLTVSDGYYHGAANVYGGCIDSSSGNVFLSHVVVSGCAVLSDNGFANGGGVAADVGNVTLVASRISGNHAAVGAGNNHGGWGGGVYSLGPTLAWYSSISGNTADKGFGGGIATQEGVTAIASTIDQNTGGYGGGIGTTGPTTIVNSTISRNAATSYEGGGIHVFQAPLSIANSTIAFNEAASVGTGGVNFQGAPGSNTLTLTSSIIYGNTSGAANAPSDIYVVPGTGSLAGADNLVGLSNLFDPVVITVTADPKLGPLQFNGGPTRTHQLLAGSPALGIGNISGLPPTITTDQRGNGYPRTTGPNTSVDLGATQFDSIFVDSFNSLL